MMWDKFVLVVVVIATLCSCCRSTELNSLMADKEKKQWHEALSRCMRLGMALSTDPVNTSEMKSHLRSLCDSIDASVRQCYDYCKTNKVDSFLTANVEQLTEKKLDWSQALASCMRMMLTAVKNEDKETSKDTLSNTCKKYNKTFKIIKDKKLTWYNAMKDCEQRNMKLASTENEEEFNRVIKQINDENKSGVDYFVAGLNIEFNNYQFIWMTTLRSVNYRNDWPGDVNMWPLCTGGQREQCLGLKHISGQYKMNDFCCNWEMHYVCESLACVD